MRRSTRGKITISFGGLCLVAALVLTVANHAEERRAALTASTALAEVEAVIAEGAPADVDDSHMVAVAIGESPYIGVLEIPAIDISLPVIGSYSEQAMKDAPTLYTGSYREDNMIVAGHNYKDHFAALPQLVAGDLIRFTDLLGAEYRYTVDAVEIIGGRDVEGMLGGDWDLTLFTCTYDGADRVTIRCSLADDSDVPIKA